MPILRLIFSSTWCGSITNTNPWHTYSPYREPRNRERYVKESMSALHTNTRLRNDVTWCPICDYTNALNFKHSIYLSPSHYSALFLFPFSGPLRERAPSRALVCFCVLSPFLLSAIEKFHKHTSLRHHQMIVQWIIESRKKNVRISVQRREKNIHVTATVMRVHACVRAALMAS